jgi:hypothetical protein
LTAAVLHMSLQLVAANMVAVPLPVVPAGPPEEALCSVAPLQSVLVLLVAIPDSSCKFGIAFARY